MTAPKIEAPSDRRSGVLPGVVLLALDVAEKGQSTAIAMLQDARAELRTVVDHSIELVEKATAAAFRFTRKTVQRIDEVGSETLSGAERVIGGAVKSARETTTSAAQRATSAFNGTASA